LPERVRQSILKLALEGLECSARELAVLYTERHGYFVSESSVYRLLKAHDLITSPAFVLLKAADKFQYPTPHPISCGKPILPIVRPASGGVWMTLPGPEHAWNARG